MKFEKMKEIRETKELKQWQIANELKVDRSTYAGWETGKDTIPLRKLYELSNYYKISIDYITGLSKKNNYIYSGDLIDLNRVAKNLKKLRIDNNLKQRDIFNMLNIASSSYSVYETGQTLIQTSFIYQIAKKYNSSIDNIIKSND
jgi:transcriptional regulator with XRE-family HTH domain